MLLSDRDIRLEVASGRLQLDPWDPELVQPSSIDVRLDRFFRVFNNQQYTHIDPALQQDDLTTLVEIQDGDSFVLHPGSSSSAPPWRPSSLPTPWPAAWRASPRSAGSA